MIIIVVYENSVQFITSFGRFGQNAGEFDNPCCITSCVDGYIHVCDYVNDRVQIFLKLFVLIINDIHVHDINSCINVHDHLIPLCHLTIIIVSL